MYWLALAFSALLLLAAGAWSTLTHEPLWMRLTTFAFLGCLPALAFYFVGRFISWTLNITGVIYDLAAPFYRARLMELRDLVAR
jgi:hypothetical protein